MLYLACLIRAREPEDKSGWSEDVSPLRVVNRGQSSLLPPSQPWSTALFEFIPAFSIRREIALMKESCTYCMYNSRDDIVYVFGKVIESLKNPAEILATFFRVGEKRDESIAFASSSSLLLLFSTASVLALSRVETISKLSFFEGTRDPTFRQGLIFKPLLGILRFQIA